MNNISERVLTYYVCAALLRGKSAEFWMNGGDEMLMREQTDSAQKGVVGSQVRESARLVVNIELQEKVSCRLYEFISEIVRFICNKYIYKLWCRIYNYFEQSHNRTERAQHTAFCSSLNKGGDRRSEWIEGLCFKLDGIYFPSPSHFYFYMALPNAER